MIEDIKCPKCGEEDNYTQYMDGWSADENFVMAKSVCRCKACNTRWDYLEVFELIKATNRKR